MYDTKVKTIRNKNVRDYLEKHKEKLIKNWEQRPTYDELTDCTDIIPDKIYRFKENRYDFWGSKMGENEGLFSIHDYGRMLCKVGVAERLGTLYKDEQIEMLDTLTLRLLTDMWYDMRFGKEDALVRRNFIFEKLLIQFPNMARHITIRYIMDEPDKARVEYLLRLLTQFYNDLFTRPLKGHGIQERDDIYAYNVLSRHIVFSGENMKTVKSYTPKKYNKEFDKMEQNRKNLVLKFLGKASKRAKKFLKDKLYKDTLNEICRKNVDVVSDATKKLKDQADEYFKRFPNLSYDIDIDTALDVNINPKMGFKNTYLLLKLEREQIKDYIRTLGAKNTEVDIDGETIKPTLEKVENALKYLTNKDNVRRENIESELDKYFKCFDMLLFTLVDQRDMVLTMHRHFDKPKGEKIMYILEKLKEFNYIPVVTQPLKGTEDIYLYNVITYDLKAHDNLASLKPTRNIRSYDDVDLDDTKKVKKQHKIRDYLNVAQPPKPKSGDIESEVPTFSL